MLQEGASSFFLSSHPATTNRTATTATTNRTATTGSYQNLNPCRHSSSAKPLKLAETWPTSGQISVPSSGKMELSSSPLWTTILQVPISTSNPMLSWLGALHSRSAMAIWCKLLQSAGQHGATPSALWTLLCQSTPIVQVDWRRYTNAKRAATEPKSEQSQTGRLAPVAATTTAETFGITSQAAGQVLYQMFHQLGKAECDIARFLVDRIPMARRQVPVIPAASSGSDGGVQPLGSLAGTHGRGLPCLQSCPLPNLTQVA